MANRIYLSIGSNTNAEENLKAVVKHLHDRANVVAVSPVYQSADVLDTDTIYLNAAIIVETPYTLHDAKITIFQAIETELGRKHGGQTVTADIDVILFNQEVLEYGGREVPEPELLKQPHIALPFADIAPDYVHPTDGRTLADIAAALNDGSVQLCEDKTLQNNESDH